MRASEFAQRSPRSAKHQTAGLRLAAWFGAGAATLLLGACGTAVSLNSPPPIINIPMSQPAQPPAPPVASQPAPAASQPSAVIAQPLQPTPGIAVQPLGPASSPLSSASQPAPMASAPATPGSAAQPAYTPATGPLPANAVRFICNDRTSFIATFGDVSVTLSTALGVVKLEQTVATDGARYKNGDLQVWFKGRQATITNLTQAGSTTLCVEQR